MPRLPLLRLAAACGLGFVAFIRFASAQELVSPVVTSLAPSPLPAEAIQPGPASAPRSVALANADGLAYRLGIWGDLFTPREESALETASAMWGSIRTWDRAKSGDAAQRDARLNRGSAAASAAAWGLVFGGTPPPDGPVEWGQPGNSLTGALTQRSIYMAANWAERSRPSNAWGDSGMAELWALRAIALLPGPRGSLGTQVGMTGARVGLISLVSGRWPQWSAMSPAEWDHFAKLWTQRMLAATVAVEFNRLLSAHAANVAPRRRAPLATLFSESY